MDAQELKLECVKLAVSMAPRTADSPEKRVVEIASAFYNHITEAPAPAGSSLTAQVDKHVSGPTKKR